MRGQLLLLLAMLVNFFNSSSLSISFFLLVSGACTNRFENSSSDMMVTGGFPSSWTGGVCVVVVGVGGVFWEVMDCNSSGGRLLVSA